MMYQRGCGFEEAYHPWSSGNYHYSATELLQHLIKVCIPLSRRKIPKQRPLELPPPPKAYKLGTKSADLEEIETTTLEKEDKFRLDCLIERDRLENEGEGDQLFEFQEVTWPLKRMKKGGFKIDMCFDMIEDGEPVLLWCTGVVTKIIKDRAEKDNMSWQR